MEIRTFIVDSFTDKPFSGNPAGVCLLSEPLDAGAMQAIAEELNASETAFVSPRKGKTDCFEIRYFSPLMEIDFCGHATLASAKVLFSETPLQSLVFETTGGLQLGAEIDHDDILMTFPVFDTKPFQPDRALLDAFAIAEPLFIGFVAELGMLLIEVRDKQTLLAVSPDFSKALQIKSPIKEVVVTCISPDAEFDFYSRCFCPWLGINEDPVTGSSHSALSAYWSQRTGKKVLSAFQLSARGGYMNLHLVSEKELHVRGKAVLMLAGTMTL